MPSLEIAAPSGVNMDKPSSTNSEPWLINASITAASSGAPIYPSADIGCQLYLISTNKKSILLTEYSVVYTCIPPLIRSSSRFYAPPISTYVTTQTIDRGNATKRSLDLSSISYLILAPFHPTFDLTDRILQPHPISPHPSPCLQN